MPAAALLLGLLALSPARSLALSPHPKRVVIVGAGVSGFAAARQVHAIDPSVHITLLEANGHPGGRTYTFDGVDLGAQWLHGIADHPWVAPCAAANVTLLPDYNEEYIDPLGTKMSSAAISAMWKAYGTLMKWVSPLQDSTNVDEPLQQGINAELKAKSSKLKSPYNAYFSNMHAKTLLDYAIRSDITENYAGDPTQLSLWWWDDDDYLIGGEKLPIIGTGATLLKVFPLPSSATLLLNHVVTKIDLSNKSAVQVFVQGVSAPFETDAVICTAPLGVLQYGSIAFIPDVTSNFRKALTHRGSGWVWKVSLFFVDTWWPGNHMVFYYANASVPATEFYDVSFSKGSPALNVFVTGEPFIQAYKSWTDAQVVADILAQMRSLMFKSLRVPDPSGFLVTRWTEDPHARGAWSYNAVGINPAVDFQYLVEGHSDSRLVFAGEHTTRRHFGTIHGAWWSGLRAANMTYGAPYYEIP